MPGKPLSQPGAESSLVSLHPCQTQPNSEETHNHHSFRLKTEYTCPLQKMWEIKQSVTRIPIQIDALLISWHCGIPLPFSVPKYVCVLFLHLAESIVSIPLFYPSNNLYYDISISK